MPLLLAIRDASEVAFFFRGQCSAYIYNRRGKLGGAHNGNKNVNLWGGKRTSFGSAGIHAYKTGSKFPEKSVPFITQPCRHLSDHPCSHEQATPILRGKAINADLFPPSSRLPSSPWRCRPRSCCKDPRRNGGMVVGITGERTRQSEKSQASLL